MFVMVHSILVFLSFVNAPLLQTPTSTCRQPYFIIKMATLSKLKILVIIQSAKSALYYFKSLSTQRFVHIG